ncbi:MAG: TonB-dependent receptor [Oligoflexia bacterium]|nr:TonB-dependent receptor [Oligoflexia bacterium]
MLRRILPLLSIGFLALQPFAVLAQTAQELAGLSLEQLMEVQVTSSSKTPISLSKAPGNVEVITRDDLKRFGYRKVSEALQRIVGFNIYSLQYDFAFIRGFSVPGDFNTRMLLLIDGHRTNDNNFHQGFIGDEFPDSFENIERIEVSKGPGSAVWGTNAMLAVINVVTRKPEQIGKAEASYEYGSHNRSKGFVATAGQEGKLSYSLNGSYLDSDGQAFLRLPNTKGGTDDLIIKDNDQEYAHRVSGTFDYGDVRLNVAHGERQTQVPYGFFGVIQEDGGNIYSDDYTRVDLSVDTLIDKELDEHFAARFYYDDWGFDGDYIYAGEEQGSRLVNSDKGVSELYGFELRYSRELLDWLSMVVGAEAQDNYKLSILNFYRDPQSPNFITAREPYQLYSYYTELHFGLADNLELIGGVRGDIYTNQDNSATPRATLIYNPFEDSTLRLMYGEGYRVSSNFERNYADSVATIANHDLNPEQIRTTEASWQQKIAEGVQATLNVYYYTFSDLLVQTQNADGLFLFDNSDADAYAKGAELSLLARLGGGLSAYGGITTFETRQAGERLPASPRVLANAGVSVPLWDNTFFVSPEMRYVGSSNGFSPGEEVDSYFSANLNILTKPFGDDIELSGGVYNLFDEDYSLPAGPATPYDSHPQDGRTFRAQALFRFR